jgi:iron complex transport system permease protein
MKSAAVAMNATPRPTPLRMGRVATFAGILLLALAGIASLALMLGVTPIPSEQVFTILLTGEGERVPTLVIWTLRIPRFVLGMLVGAALALVGTMLQDALDNPLAEPGLLGVSGGASLVVTVVVIFGITLPFGLLPWLALMGGLAAGGFILLATQLTRDPARMILVGAAVSALFGALITTTIVLGSPNQIQRLYTYLVGSLIGRTWDDVWLVLPWLAIGMPLTFLFARALNLLQLGDEVAEGLGLPVFRTRTLILLLSTAMVAATVAVCGPIGFISLVAPHIVRRLLNTSDARQTLPIAALLGAVLLTAADLLAREIFSPTELPVGLVTIGVGSPLALFLLRRALHRSSDRESPAEALA